MSEKEQSSGLLEIMSKLEEVLSARGEIREIEKKLLAVGVSRETICMLACCGKMIDESRDLLQVLAHMADHHLMIGPGELALRILKEMTSALAFIREFEDKYETDMHLTDLTPVQLSEIVDEFEADLAKTKERRTVLPYWPTEYAEQPDTLVKD